MKYSCANCALKDECETFQSETGSLSDFCQDWEIDDVHSQILDQISD